MHSVDLRTWVVNRRGAVPYGLMMHAPWLLFTDLTGPPSVETPSDGLVINGVDLEDSNQLPVRNLSHAVAKEFGDSNLLVEAVTCCKEFHELVSGADSWNSVPVF